MINELIEMKEMMEYTLPSQQKTSNNEYISLCNYTIVYRNLSSTNIFKWIPEIQLKYQHHCALLLVRQIDYELHLLWAGTIPRDFWLSSRRKTIVEINGTNYSIVSSISIGQEGY